LISCVGPEGWHVDGGSFRSSGHLTDHHHALVTLFLFSDVGPGDGGTAMIRGSHLVIARAIAEARAGVNWDDLKPTLSAAGVLNPSESQIAHLVGQAGDVALMHPFLIHGFGANHGKRIRFACNPLVQMTDGAELERADDNYSPVELALRKGMGLE
jgi:ectoine hydroxylase-related dioxygenase (phytanoyl-CoA dioxygenase family)